MISTTIFKRQKRLTFENVEKLCEMVTHLDSSPIVPHSLQLINIYILCNIYTEGCCFTIYKVIQWYSNETYVEMSLTYQKITVPTSQFR